MDWLCIVLLTVLKKSSFALLLNLEDTFAACLDFSQALFLLCNILVKTSGLIPGSTEEFLYSLSHFL